jgi:hypothetical protein
MKIQIPGDAGARRGSRCRMALAEGVEAARTSRAGRRRRTSTLRFEGAAGVFSLRA